MNHEITFNDTQPVPAPAPTASDPEVADLTQLIAEAEKKLAELEPQILLPTTTAQSKRRSSWQKRRFLKSIRLSKGSRSSRRKPCKKSTRPAKHSSTAQRRARSECRYS